MLKHCLSCFVHLSVIIVSWTLPTNLYAEGMNVNQNTSFQLTSLYKGYLYPVPQSEQWKIIDIEGNSVGDMLYDKYVHPFNESLRYAYVSKDGQWYRIVSTGKVFPQEIPVGYDVIFDLGHGLVILEGDRVKDANCLRVYNLLLGKFIGDGFAFAAIGHGGDGLLPISTWKGERGNPETILELLEGVVLNVLDLATGKKILAEDEKYSTVRISEGIINITISAPLGNYSYLVDRQGERIQIRPDERIAIGNFKDGVARCYFLDAPSKGSCLINRSGTILSQGYKSIADNFSGLSRVVPGEGRFISYGKDFYGFVNTLGDKIIPAQYLAASDFRDGMALVQKNEDREFCLINSFGDELYQLQGIPKIEGANIGFIEWFWRTGVFVRRFRESEGNKRQLINITGTVLFETSVVQEITLLDNSRYFKIGY